MILESLKLITPHLQKIDGLPVNICFISLSAIFCQIA